MTDQKSVLITMADREGMEPKNYEAVLRQTGIFPKDGSAAELAVCLIFCRDYGLSAIRKEVFFFRDKNGVIRPIISADGWYALANKHPDMRGFELNPVILNGQFVGIECTIFRKDWVPCKHTEWLEECRRSTPAWGSHTKRMLGHRAYGQTVRKVFGISNIMDQDEYEAWQESPHDRIRKATQAREVSPVPPPPPPVYGAVPVQETPPQTKTEAIKEALRESLDQMDVEEAEVVDDHLYTTNPDRYLEDVENHCIVADTLEVLNEVRDGLYDDMLPPDREKALAHIAFHEKRIRGKHERSSGSNQRIK